MRDSMKRLGIVLAVTLLALAPAVAVVAQEEEAVEEETTLTGQLSSDDEGGYVLIEQESGESVPLTGSMDLSEHVDSTVNVTGKWIDDAEGNRSFEVSSVEPAA